MGIRDFIRYMEEHRRKLESGADLPAEERNEILKQAEMMVGMAEHAVNELESVLNNRRINLHEEHAIRFAQDIFTHIRNEEEKIKARLRERAS